MKKILFLLLAALSCCMTAEAADINLTPRPKQMVAKSGSLTLTEGFVVACGTLPDSITVEAARFVSDINATTGLGAIATSQSSGLITLDVDPSCSPEGYNLSITTTGVSVKARTTAGFFYAFQSIKKILPANVMARVYNPDITYTLPCVNITDEPRFGYRGFMLDVSRHFFTVEEVKRMIDIMAAYKMNVFHWHLTDDQGWRAEIKRYPKLTTIGATASNTRITDIHQGTYWLNAQYGPFYYTQEEMRDVVEYCRQRHIQVLPEVDMPGHFVAAMASYPEFSCTPANPPSVWTDGGISSNVLNVANDKAVQFAKNIIDELLDIFPYPYFHIGGDECPTSQWVNNAACQQLYKDLGLTDYRQLQSRFINQISGYLAQKGRRTVMWNESITAGGANLDQVKEYNPVIMCWNPCQSGAAKAAELGLQNIVTEYHSSTDGLGGGYYINRKLSSDASEPDGAGYGDDSVEGCYAYVPVPSGVSADKLPFYTGVQGTFWTEWVANPEYLEYLALPRLMAVAEAGWTPQSKKNFKDFTARMAQDTLMLNLGKYTYGRHIFRNTTTEMVRPDLGKWYRIQTTATDVRKGTCIELLSASSPLLTTYKANGAQAGRLWNNAAAQEGDANYAYQQWCLEDSPTAPGCYALVCKAYPDGSVNPNPSAQNNGGRWSYDNTHKNYAFVLGDAASGYGKTASGNYYYSIRSNAISGWYLNSSMSGQGYALNLWTDAASGNGGLWEFIPFDEGEEASLFPDFDPLTFEALPRLQTNDTITISCAVPGFEGQYMSYTKGQSLLTWTDDASLPATRWICKNVSPMDSAYCQTLCLRNVTSPQYVYSTEASSVGRIGYPVSLKNVMLSTAPTITIRYQPATHDYQILLGGKNFYPVSLTSPTNPGTISSGNSVDRSGLALRAQGAAWLWTNIALPTDINNLPEAGATDSTSPLYDLSGRRVTTPTRHGLYIRNHKVIRY